MTIGAPAAPQRLVPGDARSGSLFSAAVAGAAAVVLLGLGGALLWAWSERDVDGYFVGSAHRLSTS